MKLLKLSTLILTAGLAVGCATTSDIENLQGQLNTLKSDVSRAQSDASAAKNAANDAASRAASAESAANRAARASEEVNSKLDNMFRRNMMK